MRFEVLLIAFFAGADAQRMVRAGVDENGGILLEAPKTQFSEVLRYRSSGGTAKVVDPNEAHSDEIPKIIHLMFKDNLAQRENWTNPVWKVSYGAWKKYFPEPEYQYRFWTDADLDKFFQEKCGKHYDMYQQGKSLIYRGDLARYCFMQEIGGIYTDLDYEPRTHFYHDLRKGRVNLIESPYEDESVQNALMASPVGPKYREYWNAILDFALEKHEQNPDKFEPGSMSGPQLLDGHPMTHQVSAVHKMPCSEFQLRIHHTQTEQIKPWCGFLTEENAHKVKGIHWGTWSWVHEANYGLGMNLNDDTRVLFDKLHPDHQDDLTKSSPIVPDEENNEEAEPRW